MEKKTNELLEQALKIMGEDSDIMIIAHKNGQCGSVIHGSIDRNAQAMFACMHQEDEKVGNAVYRIIKLNAINLVTNPSPYAQDLMCSIEKAIDDKMKRIEESETTENVN